MGRIEECAVVCLDHADTRSHDPGEFVDRDSGGSRARRSAFCAHAVVTGVAFFDFQHGQTGVARNAIELHPILAFRCLG